MAPLVLMPFVWVVAFTALPVWLGACALLAVFSLVRKRIRGRFVPLRVFVGLSFVFLVVAVLASVELWLNYVPPT